MPRVCCVMGCSNRGGREVSKRFYSFPSVRDTRGRDRPKGAARRHMWMKALNRTDLTEDMLRYTSVCSDHFLLGKPAAPEDVDHPDFVPSQRLDSRRFPEKKIKTEIRLLCCVPSCPTNAKKRRGITIFGFPTDEELQERWKKAIPREDWSVYSLTKPSICRLHFHDADLDTMEKLIKYTTKDKEKREYIRKEIILRDNAVPSIFPYYENQLDWDVAFGSDPGVVVEARDPLADQRNVIKTRNQVQSPEFATVYILDDESQKVPFYDESENVELAETSDAEKDAVDVHIEVQELDFFVQPVEKEPFGCVKREATELLHEEIDIKDEPL